MLCIFEFQLIFYFYRTGRWARGPGGGSCKPRAGSRDLVSAKDWNPLTFVFCIPDIALGSVQPHTPPVSAEAFLGRSPLCDPGFPEGWIWCNPGFLSPASPLKGFPKALLVTPVPHEDTPRSLRGSIVDHIPCTPSPLSSLLHRALKYSHRALEFINAHTSSVFRATFSDKQRLLWNKDCPNSSPKGFQE